MVFHRFVFILLSIGLCFCLLAKQAEANVAIVADISNQIMPHQIHLDGDESVQDICILDKLLAFALPAFINSMTKTTDSFYKSHVVSPPYPPPDFLLLNV